MSENVFILGAGFSQEAGGPLVNDFLNEAMLILENSPGNLGLYKPFFETVRKQLYEYQKINSVFHEDLSNIEKLYSLLDFQCQYLVPTDERSEFRKSLIYLIIKTLDVKIRPELLNRYELLPGSKYYIDLMLKRERIPDINAYEEFALGLAGTLHNETPCSIISLNYDILLENAFDNRCSTKPNYFLPGHNPASESINFLKLHGSANWMTCSTAGCSQNGVISVKDNGKYLDEFIMDTCSVCNRKNLVPVIVPPSWDKTHYRDHLKKIWEQAATDLLNARRIFIIGYSFPETDLYFKSMLQSTIPFNRNLPRIFIINRENPDSDFMQKFKSMFNEDFYRRYIKTYYLRQTALQFIQGTLRVKRLKDLN